MLCWLTHRKGLKPLRALSTINIHFSCNGWVKLPHARLTNDASRHQFLVQMPKAKVSWLLCIGRLVSKTDNVMHFARLVKQASADWSLAPYLSFGAYTQTVKSYIPGVIWDYEEWQSTNVQFHLVCLDITNSDTLLQKGINSQMCFYFFLWN